MQHTGKKPFSLAGLLFSLLWIGMLTAVGVSLAFNRSTGPTYSEQENRMLQGLPELSFGSMLSGSFSGEFENYLLDHFVLRDEFTAAIKEYETWMSVASFEETLLAVEEQKDQLMADITTLPPIQEPDLMGDGEGVSSFVFSSPEETSVASPGQYEPATNTVAPTVASACAVSAAPTPNPTYPSVVSLFYTVNGKKVALQSYKAKNVEYAAKVVNSYAGCLNPGGRLCYIMVPSSYVMNKYILNKSATGLSSNIEDCLRANVADNVEVFSVADILAGPISSGEYVFFRTDRHWTPLGCHYVYEAMMNRLGMQPVPYSQYTITKEYPFLGTLYRDNPTASMKRNPDTMDIVQPYGEATFYEVTSPNNLTARPILDMKAPSRDRHAIYLGNTRAAWSVIKTKANTGRKAIVIRDSFGLILSPYLIPHYDEIHMVNPTYFRKKAAGGSVGELMKQYGIDDCYIVIGDIHSYNNEFLVSIMPRILTK